MSSRKVVLAVLLLAAIVATAVFLPVEAALTAVQGWAERDPGQARLIVWAVFLVGILLMLPASLLLMLAGFLFGALQGFLLAWSAGLVASAAAFLIGRSVARPWVEHRMRRKPLFTAIDRAIRRKGFPVVMLTRLVMVLPYPAMNYMLGLTGVSLRDYLLGTNIGMAPPMFLFVYLGTTVSSVAAILAGQVRLDRGEWILGIAALVVVVAVVALLVRLAARVLREELSAATAERAEP
ncbi:MAG: VTT domain-containing protein [Xanthomonadales bacterium]|nr:VTT domain-containing protein [Xanthomonadales bacterium]NNK32113.1 VTT domain-containing protein [Xanthomonadales bacterium]